MFTVEKDWITPAGFRAVVIMTDLGHRCGYVGVPAEHPLHGVGYSEAAPCIKPLPDDEPIGKRGIIPLLCRGADEVLTPDVAFDVHGGLTFAGGSEDYPAPSDGLWWFGYDCAHAGDRPSDEYCSEQRKLYPDKPFMWRDRDGEHRDLDYCVGECDSLAAQLGHRIVTDG